MNKSSFSFMLNIPLDGSILGEDTKFGSLGGCEEAQANLSEQSIAH